MTTPNALTRILQEQPEVEVEAVDPRQSKSKIDKEEDDDVGEQTNGQTKWLRKKTLRTRRDSIRSSPWWWWNGSCGLCVCFFIWGFFFQQVSSTDRESIDVNPIFICFSKGHSFTWIILFFTSPLLLRSACLPLLSFAFTSPALSDWSAAAFKFLRQYFFLL